MKSLYLLLILTALSAKLYAPGDRAILLERPAVINPFTDHWDAVCWIESRYDPLVINPAEQAYGISQIRQCKLDDYNLAHGTSFKLTDCLDPVFSRKVFMWHCCQYPDPDEAVRRWNGSGPDSYDYLDNVRTRMRLVSSFQDRAKLNM